MKFYCIQAISLFCLQIFLTTNIHAQSNISTTTTELPITSSSSTTQTSTVSSANITTKSLPKVKNDSISNKQQQQNEYLRSPYCFCDQKINVCDINCCCDLDCLPKHKAIFSQCDDYKTITNLGTLSPVKQQSCYRQDYIYNNNTPYSIHRENRNLFCIVNDNFKQEQVLIPPSQLKLQKLKPNFHWTSTVSLDIKKLDVAMAGYKYGNLLLSLRQIEGFKDTEYLVNYFQLPSNIHGKSCLGFEPLKFLQDSNTICEYDILTSKTSNNYNNADEFQTNCEKFPALNANTYFPPNTTIVGSIDLKSTEEKLINFTFTICQSKTIQKNGIPVQELLKCYSVEVDDSGGTSNNNNIPSPKYESSGKCKNVLEYIQITIVHQGIEGIQNIFVEIHLKEVSSAAVKSQHLLIQQQFQVKFLWYDEYEKLTSTSSNTSPDIPGLNNNGLNPNQNGGGLLLSADLPKSGNPGYIIGKEIIMGTLISNEDLKSTYSIPKIANNNGSLVKLNQEEVDNGNKASAAAAGTIGIGLLGNDKYLTTINAGNCQLNNRRAILFGMNMKSSCKISLENYKYCEELGIDLGSILLGIHPSNFTNKFVASFGNPFILQKQDDWIPITIQNNPFSTSPNSVTLVSNGCNNGLITSLHIQIIYAYVGPVILPQAQIQAIIYNYGNPINLKSSSSTVNGKQQDKELTLSTTVEFLDITTEPIYKIAQWPTISIQLPSDFFYPFSSSRSIHQKLSLCSTIVTSLLIIVLLYA